MITDTLDDAQAEFTGDKGDNSDEGEPTSLGRASTTGAGVADDGLSRGTPVLLPGHVVPYGRQQRVAPNACGRESVTSLQEGH